MRIKRIFLLLYLFLFIFIASKEAFMSKVYYEKITLEEMVKQSNAIFIVEKATPFLSIEDIKIHENVEKYPPFKKTTYHYRVIEVLFGNKDLCKKKIRVMSPDNERALRLHKDYYLKGISKSPIYQSYSSRFDLVKDKKVILFLNHVKKDEYKLTVLSAVESIQMKTKITELIRTLK